MKERTIRDSRHESSRQMMPADANPLGNVFGGAILRYIDEVAAVVCIRHARGRAVTASIERMDFIEPVLVGDLLHIKAALVYTGRTSMVIGVRVEAENLADGRLTRTGSCYLTFVAIDERGRPRAVAPIVPTDEEEKRWHEKGRQIYETRRTRRAGR